ncbi:MAG: hypothetical protein R6W94_14365 [Spirochaetia bacterium]
MLQFYFLSILTLILSGVALIGASSRAFDHEVSHLLTRTWVKMTIGGVTLVVGVVKLIVTATPESAAVVGDLLPALAGIAVGLALAVEGWANRAAQSAEAQKINQAASFYRIPLGVVAIATAVAHFFVPAAVIL